MGLLKGFSAVLFGKKKEKHVEIKCTSFKTFEEDELFIVPSNVNGQASSTVQNDIPIQQVQINGKDVIKIKKTSEKQNAQNLFANNTNNFSAINGDLKNKEASSTSNTVLLKEVNETTISDYDNTAKNNENAFIKLEPAVTVEKLESKAPKSILKSKTLDEEDGESEVVLRKKSSEEKSTVMFRSVCEEIPPPINYGSRPSSIEDYITDKYDDVIKSELNNMEIKATEVSEQIVKPQKARYSVADTYSSSAASIFFDDYEPEPEERNRKIVMADSDSEGSEADC